MSVKDDTKIHLWGRPIGGEWRYLDSVENWKEKNPLLERHRITLGENWSFRFLHTKDQYHGRTYRMIGLNQNEKALLSALVRNKTLDITKPFYATQALQAIRTQREKDGKNVNKSVPNKYRMNYIFKKSSNFECHKDTGGGNLWVFRGGVIE